MRNHLRRTDRQRFALVASIGAGVALALALTGCASGSGPDFTGTWGANAQGEPSIEIMEDGSFSGTDGCNRIFGQGKIAGDTFEFGAAATTQMACPDVKVWLVDPASAKLVGGKLEISDSKGEVLGTLPKA